MMPLIQWTLYLGPVIIAVLLIVIRMKIFYFARTKRFNSKAQDLRIINPKYFNDIQNVLVITGETSDDILELKKGLEKEKSKNPNLKLAWEFAKRLYFSKKETAALGNDEDEIPPEFYIALIAYIVESEFYKEFNKLTREYDVTNVTREKRQDFRYKNYFKLLSLALDKVKGYPELIDLKGVKVYRGIQGPINVSLGHLILFQHFLSTSRDLNMAQLFAKGVDVDNKVQDVAKDKCTGTVFVIDGIVNKDIRSLDFVEGEIPKRSKAACLDRIAGLLGSDYKNEHECLVSPCETFQVVKIDEPRDDRFQFVYLKVFGTSNLSHHGGLIDFLTKQPNHDHKSNCKIM